MKVLTQRRRDTKPHFVILFNLVNPVKKLYPQIITETQRFCEILFRTVISFELRSGIEKDCTHINESFIAEEQRRKDAESFLSRS